MKIKVFVSEQDWTGEKSIYVIEEGNGKRFNLSMKDGSVVRSDIDERSALDEDRTPPFLKLPEYLARDLFPALVETLSKKGFDSPSESTLRGENGALKAHLQDLRIMVGLVPGVVVDRPKR